MFPIHLDIMTAEGSDFFGYGNPSIVMCFCCCCCCHRQRIMYSCCSLRVHFTLCRSRNKTIEIFKNFSYTVKKWIREMVGIVYPADRGIIRRVAFSSRFFTLAIFLVAAGCEIFDFFSWRQYQIRNDDYYYRRLFDLKYFLKMHPGQSSPIK
jgi:hypothetical protein